MILVTATASYILILALLAALAVYDLKYYILPDKMNAALALAFSAFHIATHWSFITPLIALEGALAGGGLLLILRMIANRFYDDDALGLGDVKLMAAAGIGLGFPDILLALSAGAGIGLAHGLLMGWRQKKPTARSILAASTCLRAWGFARE